MNLQRAEAARERLVLIARNLLITEEQHLVLDECGADFVEGLIAELAEMNAADFSAQRSGNWTNRYMPPIFHRDFSLGHDTRRCPTAPPRAMASPTFLFSTGPT